MNPQHAPNLKRDGAMSRRNRRRNRAGAVALLLGGVMAVFLLLASLFGQIRLTALNDEAVRLSASIEQHRREQAQLLINHEMIYDLYRVENYAREELGMHRPRGDQLQPLEPQLPDRVTLYPENADTLVGWGISLLDSIAACFR